MKNPIRESSVIEHSLKIIILPHLRTQPRQALETTRLHRKSASLKPMVSAILIRDRWRKRSITRSLSTIRLSIDLRSSIQKAMSMAVSICHQEPSNRSNPRVQCNLQRRTTMAIPWVSLSQSMARTLSGRALQAHDHAAHLSARRSLSKI